MKNFIFCAVQVIVHSLLQKLIFSNTGQNLRKSSYRSIQVLPNFVWFLIFLQNISWLIVDNNLDFKFKNRVSKLI